MDKYDEFFKFLLIAIVLILFVVAVLLSVNFIAEIVSAGVLCL